MGKVMFGLSVSLDGYIAGKVAVPSGCVAGCVARLRGIIRRSVCERCATSATIAE
jgi:hypothetical protein